MNIDTTLEFVNWKNYKTRFHAVAEWMQQSAAELIKDPDIDLSEWVNISLPAFVTDIKVINTIKKNNIRNEQGELGRMNFVEFYDIDIIPSPFINNIQMLKRDGGVGPQCGAFLYKFATFECLISSMFFDEPDFDPFKLTAIAYIRKSNIDILYKFSELCSKILKSVDFNENFIQVIGGWQETFKTITTLDDVILPDDLKNNILREIISFFDKGVEVYTHLKLNPFRKMLFAGPPGTGKTTLCKAISQWALQNNYVVIYVMGSDQFGGTFDKIHQSLTMAANSERPAIIVVEELDTYVQNKSSRSQILNVLDGIETPVNEYGTYMIATTNHPEIIDDRILKRPGRIDRIFIMPDFETAQSCENMMRYYMGHFWKDEFLPITEKLVHKSGAFIRELCIFSLTYALSNNLTEITSEFLLDNIQGLSHQIEEDFNFEEDSEEIGFATRTAPMIGSSLKSSRRSHRDGYRGYS